MPDSAERFFDYFRDVTRGPTLFLDTPTAAVVREARAAFGHALTIVTVGPVRQDEHAAAQTGDSGDAAVRSLTREVPQLRRALFGAGPEGTVAMIADANQRVVGFHGGSQVFASRDFASLDFGSWLAAMRDAVARPDAAERRDGAPVLLLPNVLEPELRAALIQRLDAEMVEGRVAIRDGNETRSVTLPDKKRRRDHTLQRDDPLYRAAADRIARRVMPELYKAFWIEKLRHEGYFLARYDADRADFFAAHRDNNTPGTAKRRIAVSVELNEDYEGGGLIFPEYADHRHRAPMGGALAFSCSLMHEAVPVSRGSRYVLLAFLAAV
jgi:predicted 2-oxoglutarate/Fe(II)-dependent dioxygenase YbiX